MSGTQVDAWMAHLDLEESPEEVSKSLEAATKEEQAEFLDWLLMEALLVDTLGKRRPQAVPAKQAAPRTILLIRAAQRDAVIGRPAGSHVLPRGAWRHRAFKLLPAAALLMTVLGLSWMWHTRFGYPEPRLILGSSATGGVTVKMPRRGESIKVAPGRQARLMMGGYCDLALAPGAEIILRGEPRREAIELVEGRVVSEITPQRGEYTVHTPRGWVKVKGTRFATSVEYSSAPKGGAGESRPKESATVTVAVTSGVVEYQLGGQTGTLRAGETWCFPQPKTQGQIEADGEALYRRAEKLRPGNPEESLKIHQELVAKYPKDRLAGAALTNSARILHRLGRYDEALAAYRRVIDEYRGSRFFRVGRADEAAAYEIGHSYYAKGDKDGARKAFEAALQRFPNSTCIRRLAAEMKDSGVAIKPNERGAKPDDKPGDR